METTPLHFAIRELHSSLRTPTPWICALAAGVILALLAPFGTEDTLPLSARLFYWMGLACLTLFTGTFVNSLLRKASEPLPDPPHLLGIAAMVGVGALIGLAVLAEVFALNWLVFGLSPLRPGYGLPVGLNTMVISIVVNCAITWVTLQIEAPATDDPAGDGSDDQSRANPPATPPAPPILDRLPFDKRGQLISLSVQDHYVEITTSKGRDMVLMRLSDAVREAGPGFQIHRSHWVAEGAVTAAQRKSGAAEVTLLDGRSLPVSRSHLPTLKEKGLLPR